MNGSDAKQAAGRRLLIGWLAVALACAPGGEAAAAVSAGMPSAGAESAAESAGRAPEPAQLFDVSRGEVIRTAPNTPELRRVAASWIASIRGVWGGLRPEPRSGYIVKVPFEPPLFTDSVWYRGEVKELYAMWDPKAPGDTRLLLLGRDGSVRVFVIGANVGPYVERFRTEGR
ncbi:hypothetical protein [Paenibacillus flagellatus]|uniref:Uncharacterized protein n=1 Tax=Paenibacillus flagellatus TaxID=2211139 RepID=A0A2V5JW40_9BACL|nr:hypothetical protein [Paenibacillus flagellatus]PYI50888.1 hypothetical protein DLM86_27875 [Paenibacillus flagellatus]